MKKQLQMLARFMATMPVPEAAKEPTPEEITAMAIAIVDLVEEAAEPGRIAMMPWQNIDDGPDGEWHYPTREEAIEEQLQHFDGHDLDLHGMDSLREHYAWAKQHLAERDIS
ncbi:MAG: hypothetical protein E6X99_23050 [Pantoea sp.]|nr:hypothetical protein [Pantoea sp.]